MPVERIGFVVNMARPSALAILERARAWARSRRVTLVLGDMGFGTPPGDEACLPIAQMGPHCDAVVVVGGDGTFLRAAPLLAPSGVPVVAVNTGTFGFLATAEAEELEHLLDELLAGALREEERNLLEVVSGGARALALNDVVLHRAEAARVVEYEVRVGGALVSRFSADGVCVSTPTGSTAYNLSAGGPVVCPQVGVMVITPICAHTLAMRSMVVSDGEHVLLQALSPDALVHLVVDGRVVRGLRRSEEVSVVRAKEVVRLLQRRGRTFYEVLRRKLGWATREERECSYGSR